MKHRKLLTTALAVISATTVGLVGASADAADPTDKCHSGKLKESARYVSCRLRADAKAILKLTAPDYSKCTAKFPSKFNDQETKAGPGICVTEGDGASIDDWLTRDANDIAMLLGGGVISRVPQTGQTRSYGVGDDGDLQPGVALQYVDNGDGTITDRATGLMWEKKYLSKGPTCDDRGSCQNPRNPCNDERGTCADPHMADNVYSWSAADAEPFDGTVVTIFLEQLNNRCHQDATVSCTSDADCEMQWPGGPCGFAGHRDWRLPTIKELQSIIDYSEYRHTSVQPPFLGSGCSYSECVDIRDPECSCTVPDYYWSSTSYRHFAWGAVYAYAAAFGIDESGLGQNGAGLVSYSGKGYPLYVRAVRGGS